MRAALRLIAKSGKRRRCTEGRRAFVRQVAHPPRGCRSSWRPGSSGPTSRRSCTSAPPLSSQRRSEQGNRPSFPLPTGRGRSWVASGSTIERAAFKPPSGFLPFVAKDRRVLHAPGSRPPLHDAHARGPRSRTDRAGSHAARSAEDGRRGDAERTDTEGRGDLTCTGRSIANTPGPRSIGEERKRRVVFVWHCSRETGAATTLLQRRAESQCWRSRRKGAPASMAVADLLCRAVPAATPGGCCSDGAMRQRGPAPFVEVRCASSVLCVLPLCGQREAVPHRVRRPNVDLALRLRQRPGDPPLRVPLFHPLLLLGGVVGLVHPRQRVHAPRTVAGSGRLARGPRIHANAVDSSGSSARVPLPVRSPFSSNASSSSPSACGKAPSGLGTISHAASRPPTPATPAAA